MRVRPLTREEVRSVDAQAAEELGLPTLVLMENAGRGAAAWLRDQGVVPGSRVLIVCGPGNNGGDGGVVARHLDAWGVAVRVVWFAHPGQLHGDAAVQHGILARSGIAQIEWGGDGTGRGDDPIDWLEPWLASADWVVDALLGTGLTRPVEGTLHAAITAINRSGKPVLALDIPSGLDTDSGRPLGLAVRARATATFVAPKLGFTAPGAAEFTGEVVVVEIGVPRCLLEPFQTEG